MLRIGSVTLETNLLLAPIAGYCDLAFRTICREFNRDPRGIGAGLGLACTDLLSPQGLLRGTATSLDLARTSDFDKPVGMQLYGSDPQIMADGARWAEDHGASIIDINMGCPVDKVCKKDGGSRLLCIPDTAERIVEQVARAVSRPVTVKMRLGWFDGQPVAEWLAPRLVRAGACAVTIHGRTTEQKFAGSVSHDGIRRVVEAVKALPGGGVPVIGNGDVKEPADAAEMIRRTGCDGVMIGRGALSAPWLFRDTWAHLAGRPVPPEPELSEKIALIERWFTLMLEYRGEHYALTQIRRRLSWFAKRFHHDPARPDLPPGARLPRRVSCKPLKEAVRLAEDPPAVRAALADFLAGGLRLEDTDLQTADDLAPAGA